MRDTFGTTRHGGAVTRAGAWATSLALALAGCVGTQVIDLSHKTCPCADGWVCDEARDVCVPEGEPIVPPPPRPDAGGVPDAGPAPDAFVPTDAGGAPDAGTPAAEIWIEAESVTPMAPMEQQAAVDAAGGAFLTTPDTGAGVNASPETAGGRATYVFRVTVAGPHRVWGRVSAASTNDDSFWVRMDDGPYHQWNNLAPAHMGWEWETVHHTDMAAPIDPVVYDLTVGEHTLVVVQREEATRLDKLVVTRNATFVPSGLGL